MTSLMQDTIHKRNNTTPVTTHYVSDQTNKYFSVVGFKCNQFKEL